MTYLKLFSSSAAGLAHRMVLLLSLAPALACGAPNVSVNEVERGSLLLSASADDALRAAPLLETDVTMSINAMIARVTVRQSFRNDGADWVNGIYVFPLPTQSAVDHLHMQVGERRIEGRIEEREAARRTFESARDSGRKASLVEQQRPNLFTTRVANIGPAETVVVVIEYQQTLTYDEGWFSLRFPMTAGVRYIPGSGPVEGFDGGGWSFNSDEVADASAITPPVSRVGEGHDNPVSIRIDLNAGMPLAAISSPYHAITSSESGLHRWHIELDAGQVPAERDFELRFRPVAAHVPRAAFFRQDVGDERYGLLMLMPPEAARSKQLAMPREVIFVVDTSGSMHGTSITQARAALAYGLSRLHSDDTFNIVQFNSSTARFAPQALPANPANLSLARAWVDSLRADGGTEMAAALNAVLDGRESHPRLRQVIFITDGSVGNEQALFRIIDRRLGGSRLFTVGIGSAPNGYFMREAAHIGRGSFTYIGKLEEVDERMRGVFEKLEFPVLSDIRVANTGAKLAVIPAPISDLYSHEPLLLHLRLNGATRLELHGMLAGKPWTTTVPVTTGGQARGLDIAWARESIAGLERSLARGADRGSVRNAITALGLRHHMVTAHTSLVAVEVTPSRPPEASARDAHLKSKMPAGWSMATPAPRLPQTATPWLAQLLVAAFMAVCGVWARTREVRA